MSLREIDTALRGLADNLGWSKGQEAKDFTDEEDKALDEVLEKRLKQKPSEWRNDSSWKTLSLK